MSSNPFQHLLIIDSAPTLQLPYSTLFSLLSSSATLTHLQTLEEARQYITKSSPDLILLSSQFPEPDSLNFLELLKSTFTKQITPVLFTIDWSFHRHHILGTSWAGAVGILHNLSSAAEIRATLQRLQEISLS
jgi:DNA-binding NarL/FixJ family response regulator